MIGPPAMGEAAELALAEGLGIVRVSDSVLPLQQVATVPVAKGAASPRCRARRLVRCAFVSRLKLSMALYFQQLCSST